MFTNKLSIEAGSKILNTSKITSTETHAGMQLTELTHPKLGKLTLIQAAGEGFMMLRSEVDESLEDINEVFNTLNKVYGLIGEMEKIEVSGSAKTVH